MERQKYFNFISEKLSTLAYSIMLSGKLNVLDLHIHAENFYRDLFNLVYGWNLVNLNEISQNEEAIDLADVTNKDIGASICNQYEKESRFIFGEYRCCTI